LAIKSYQRVDVGNQIISSVSSVEIQ